MIDLAKTQKIRTSVQLVFFLFVAFIVVLNYLIEQNVINWPKIKDLHGICPFGGVETLSRLIFENEYVPKTSLSNLIGLIAVILPTLILGPTFCGWLCPLGSIQEWIGKIGKKIFKRKYNNIIPPWLDRILGLGRYLVLFLILIFTYINISLVFNHIDPFYALYHFWTGQAMPTALIILGIVLLLSLIIERPWCRWFCPLGAILGLIGLVAPYTIRRFAESCNSCRACQISCPFKINLEKTKNLKHVRCNRCLRCLDSGYKKSCLSFGLSSYKFNLDKKPVLLALIVLGLFFLPIGVEKAVKAFSLQLIQTKVLNPNEITSTLTLKELALGVQINLKEIISLFNLPQDIDPETKLRDLEDINEKLTIKEIKRLLEAHLTPK